MKFSRALGVVTLAAVALAGGVVSAAEAQAMSHTKFPFSTLKGYIGQHGISFVEKQIPNISRNQIVELAKDSTVHITKTGRLMYVERPVPASAPSSSISPQRISSIALSQFDSLNSRPGSTKTIFLDFDGHTVPAGTMWDQPGQGNPTVAGYYPPFSTDSDPAISDLEKQIIIDAWSAIAEDYAIFDVNVTTQDPGSAAIDRTGEADQVFGTRALITPGNDSWNASTCGCGGIAMGGVFNSSVDDFYGDPHDFYQPAFAFSEDYFDGKLIADVVSHEVGHNLGLSHDGLGTKSLVSPTTGFSAPACMGGTHKDNIEYFLALTYTWWVGNDVDWAEWSAGDPPCNATGDPDIDIWQAYSTSTAVLDNWAPIMGAGYYKGITQWSMADAPYPTPASNRENDLAVMQDYGLSLKADELTQVAPFTATSSNTLTTTAFNGTITSANDTDFMLVSVTDGTLGVNVASPTALPDLDVKLSLFDSKGKSLFSVDPASSSYADWQDTFTVEGMGAVLSADLPNGTYFIKIDGTGKSGSYSDYGSIGNYSVKKQAPAAATIPTKGTPTISGTKRKGRTLTGAYGTWTSGTAFVRQWLRDGVVISGATSKTYVLTAADVGHKIQFRVIATKGSYRKAIKVSAKTVTITN